MSFLRQGVIEIENTNLRNERKAGRFISNIIGILLCVVFIPILIINLTLIVKSFVFPDKVPDFMGYKPFIVLSGSMEPEFYSGDLAMVKIIDPVYLSEGDVIAFRLGESVITHRIVGITDEQNGEREFSTKGDNNNVVDNFTVKENMIEGKYLFNVPKIGNSALFLQTPTGLVLFVALPLVLFILYDLFRRQLFDNKSKKRTEELEAELEKMRQQLAEKSNCNRK